MDIRQNLGGEFINNGSTFNGSTYAIPSYYLLQVRESQILLLLPVYATSCLFTTSYHRTKPSADLEPLWWKRDMNNNNSRAKIRKLIHFIAVNETLLFPKDGDNN
ncbi:hypothetical protein AVEN_89122-1 [Araneus ventricosus]|uniref:Uncharacterized protein n=1 Tax=Araneus ventricosus TaxID=182803 RepID=A0A4Y2B2L6_ARAVE|nr:hypothetical protein AVEN_89122-1 [Araneus ventricosus]